MTKMKVTVICHSISGTQSLMSKNSYTYMESKMQCEIPFICKWIHSLPTHVYRKNVYTNTVYMYSTDIIKLYV